MNHISGNTGNYLVIYDISDRKMLTKVQRLLERAGFIRFQKSVYFIRDYSGIGSLSRQIRNYLNDCSLSEVRIYRLCQHCADPFEKIGQIKRGFVETAVETQQQTIVF